MADTGDPVDPEEVENEDDGEFPFLKADHPLLARVQSALREQLSGQHERVQLKLREFQEEHKQLVKHREDVGVTLYGSQQQLAKLQLQLEQLHDQVAVVVRSREEAEEKLVTTTETYNADKEHVDGQLKKLQKAQDELAQLEVTLRQVDDYNTQTRNEIAVTRRATHKAEENIKGIEKTKVKQDLLIDKMNEEIKRLTEQKAVYDAQLVAQKQETQAAVATLTEAAREMEAVEFEKRQLQQQLKSSLIGMQRRDAALQNVDNALREQAENELAIDSEMRGIALSTRQAQDENEKFGGLLSKNEHEMQLLQGEMTKIKTDRERLAEQYGMLRKSLDHTNSETAKIKAALKEETADLDIVEKGIQKVSRSTTELFEQIEERLSQQATVKLSEMNTKKTSKKLGQLLQDQDIELQNLQNEISRVTVDSLNTKAHNQLLKDRLSQLTQDLSDREKLIDQYELEIRKRHNQIEKKQLYVDRLNREYDDKRSKQEDDSSGPLEAKIKNLRKQIEQKKKDCAEMQKSWIQKQTDLLSKQEQIDNTKDHVQDQKNRKLVLSQKRIRTEAQWESQKKEIVTLRSDVKSLQHEMDKLNSLHATNSTKQDQLSNTTQTMEAEFVRKLKEIEQSCQGLEDEIEGLKEEKDMTMEEIVESERQIMLWERKIHLEKEMQEALDPNVGQQESAGMKREIHRMELRYEQLKRRQDQMILEMERVIHKRDTIQLKCEPKAKQDPNTAGQLKRQVVKLRDNLRLCTSAAKETEERMKSRDQESKTLQENLEQAALETGELERAIEETNLDVAIQRAQAARYDEQLRLLQQRCERLEEVAQTRQGVPASKAPAVKAQVQGEMGKRKLVADAIAEVAQAHPQLETLFASYTEWHDAVDFPELVAA